MTFDIHIHGETPAELLAALQQLNTSPTPQPQSEPVTQPDKPKAPAPAKPKKAAQRPAAAPAEEPDRPKEPDPVNPTMTASESAPADPAGTSTAPTSAPSPSDSAESAPTGTPATTTSSEPDPATENKIRDLVMALMKQGRRAECQKIITSTGAKGISSLPPESYPTVWEQLVNLSHEVDNNAAG